MWLQQSCPNIVDGVGREYIAHIGVRDVMVYNRMAAT